MTAEQAHGAAGRRPRRWLTLGVGRQPCCGTFIRSRVSLRLNRTAFLCTDFALPPPRVLRVLRIEDPIRLDVDLTLCPAS